MKKIFFVVLLSLVIFLPELRAQTQVSGYINENTTWTENGTYQLTGNLTIRNNATLTIQKNVLVDMGNHKIYAGSSSAGRLEASEATFTASGTADQEIRFQDGGGGSLNGCHLTNVGIVIRDDAQAGIIIMNNRFDDIDFPLIMNPMRIPVFTANSSSVELIGLEGTINEDITLSPMQFDFALSSSLSINNQALVQINTGVSIDFKTSYLNIGSSSAGILKAENALFFTSNQSERKLNVRDGGHVQLSNCELDKISLEIESDAGESSISRCHFSNIKYPVFADINHIPDLTQNNSSVPLLAISGVLRQTKSLDVLEWDYALGGSLTVRDQSTLTIEPGVQMHLMAFNILIGTSSSAGHLAAVDASFASTSSSDKAIKVADGGTVNLSQCTFDNVFVDIDEDAGEPIVLQANFFTHCTWSVRACAQRLPQMDQNRGDNPWIGLKGDVDQDCSLTPLEWPFVLTETVTIRDGATLTIEPGSVILLNNRYLMVGSSNTNGGILIANEVRFYDLDRKYGRVYFRPPSGGSITQSLFHNCRLHIQGASPTVELCRFTQCREALYLEDNASPIIRNNDFYHNSIAVKNVSDQQADLSSNWWAHPSGPVHEQHPDGEGEKVEGSLLLTPFLTTPSTGSASCRLTPESKLFTSMITGEMQHSSFTVTNEGDQDLLITRIEPSSSSVSVAAEERIWILPDSSLSVPFTYLALEPGLKSDTIKIYTNDSQEMIQRFFIQGEGVIEQLLLNFYHIDVDSFPIVKCHFTLTDQARLPIRQIDPGQMFLREQNLAIPEFELSTRTANSAISVAMVIDRSGSMMGTPMRDAKSAAKDFISMLSNFDRACVISFNGSERLDQSFTTDKSLLHSAIDKLRVEGSTAVFDAIDLAIEQVKNQPGIKAILALTDGQDNASHLNASDVINKARQYGINIYTIGLGDEAEPTLTGIAWETGGQYYYSPTSKELAIIYRMISGQLQNLYILTYQADPEGLFPRKVELGVNIEELTASASRFYMIGNGEIDLAGAGEPFRLEQFSLATKNYFYYYINDPGELIPEGYTVSWYLNSGDQTFPCGFSYLGNGLLQAWMDLSQQNETGEYTFSFPDSADQSGGWIRLLNKPQSFKVDVLVKEINQEIDLFAGGSVGVSAIAGGVGAGVSVAAARGSASGHAGMGMTFEQDAEGNEWVSRRLEAGISQGIEAPSVNTGIKAVEAGVSGEISFTGTIGQTLLFPVDFHDPDLLIKAKAAYVLETLSLGGLAGSPFFGVVLSAIIQALKVVNPDLDVLYDDLFESWNLGATVEGTVGVSFSLSPDKDSDLPKLTFAEASESIGLSAGLTHYVQTNDLAFDLALAAAFQVGILNLEFGPVDLGNLLDLEYGAKAGIGADFNTSDGFRDLRLGFETYGAGSLAIADGFYGTTLDVCVPKPVIVQGIQRSGTLIHNLYNIFDEAGGIPELPVGINKFASSVQEFFDLSGDSLTTPDEKITIEKGETFAVGMSTDLTIGLDGALGIGAGIEFGVNLAMMDQVSALHTRYTVAHGQILPLSLSYGVSPQDFMFDLTDEIEDLISGAIDLVADGIANLVDVGEFILDYGSDFSFNAFNGACNLAGNAWDSGTAVIRSADPRNWFGAKSPFLETRLFHRYQTKRVSRTQDPWNQKSGGEDESTLYITSYAYDISLFDLFNQIAMDFEPIRLKIAIDQEMLDEIGFTEDEKALARIYRYVPENLSWIKLDQDFNPNPDTVSVDIVQSATYAIGIEIYPSHDQTPPQIIEHQPKEGDGVAPITRIWARLYESETGVGIDLSRTRLLLDGNEVYATWDPINSIIAFMPETPMNPGNHHFTIQACDFQGNTSSLQVNFSVNSAQVNNTDNHESFGIKTYPNPFSENLTIEFSTSDGAETEVSVFNIEGSKIAVLYDQKTPAGTHQITWNRRMDDGRSAIPGLYYVRIRQGNRMKVAKTILL